MRNDHAQDGAAVLVTAYISVVIMVLTSPGQIFPVL